MDPLIDTAYKTHLELNVIDFYCRNIDGTNIHFLSFSTQGAIIVVRSFFIAIKITQKYNTKIKQCNDVVEILSDNDRVNDILAFKSFLNGVLECSIPWFYNFASSLLRFFSCLKLH